MTHLTSFDAPPPIPAVARILARYDRPAIEAFIAIAIDLADTLDAPDDPDEPNFASRSDGLPGDPGDHERAGDDDDTGWPEWHARRSRKLAGGICEMEQDRLWMSPCGVPEDAEDDDQDCGHDEGEPDYRKRRNRPGDGPGCSISDTDRCMAGDDRISGGPSPGPEAYSFGHRGAGDTEDAEIWQATSNVPMDPVISYEHNPFTDQRVKIGISNLMTSYRPHAEGTMSADTGRTHRRKGAQQWGNKADGVPV